MTQIRPNFRDFGCFVLPLPTEDALFRHACRLGVTALAGAKPRRFCVGRRGKLTHIDAQRQPGHAAKAAVYSGRNHGVDPITPTTGRQIAPCAIAQHRCHARPSIAPKSRRAPGYAQKRPPPSSDWPSHRCQTLARLVPAPTAPQWHGWPTRNLRYFTRIQVCLEHSRPPATQPASFSASPFSEIVPA